MSALEPAAHLQDRSTSSLRGWAEQQDWGTACQAALPCGWDHGHTTGLPCSVQGFSCWGRVEQLLKLEMGSGNLRAGSSAWQLQVLQLLLTFLLSTWNQVGTCGSEHQQKPPWALPWTHKHGADIFPDAEAVPKKPGPPTSSHSSCTWLCPMPQQKTELCEPEEHTGCEPTNLVTYERCKCVLGKKILSWQTLPILLWWKSLQYHRH